MTRHPKAITFADPDGRALVQVEVRHGPEKGPVRLGNVA